MPDNVDHPMTPPPTEGAGPSNLKRKRPQEEPKKKSTSSIKTKKARVSKIRRPKKQKRPSDWHLRKIEIPDGAKETKLALELHIRVLWRLSNQNAIPPKVTDEVKAPFAKRFSSASQVKSTVTASLDQNTGGIHDVQAKIAEFLGSLPEGSTITNNIKRIANCHLLFMFRTVAILGLERWAPDILSTDPDSSYNLLHEHIALTTFEQVSGAFAYSHMGINLSFIRDFSLLRKFYRSFVYAYMYKLAKSEEKNPGSVAKGNVMSTVWKRRSELAGGRLDILKAQSFGERVIALAKETEAHSDDELAEENNEHVVYYIKEKEGRSTKVKNFFRMADLQRQRMNKSKRRFNKSERRREDPPMPQPSKLTAQPRRVPIDWFDPAYWNTYLTVRERADYAGDHPRVALPKAEFCRTWDDCARWKSLGEEDFMLTYGNDVLKEYDLPTEAELKQLEHWENEASNSDNDEGEDDNGSRGDEGDGDGEDDSEDN